MENKQDYLDRLAVTVSQLHNCGAVWRESVPVTEVFQGKTIWDGVVEVFTLSNHPKAKRAYGWSFHADGQEQFVAVLEIPPVDSPQTAVKVAIASQVRKAQKK